MGTWISDAIKFIVRLYNSKFLIWRFAFCVFVGIMIVCGVIGFLIWV